MALQFEYFFKTRTYQDLKEILAIMHHIYIDKSLGEKTFTSKEYNQLRETDKHMVYGYPMPTIQTLRKWGAIKVVAEDTYTVYGTGEYLWEFELIPDMTKELYDMLPEALQSHVKTQERKRYHYAFVPEFYNEINYVVNTIEQIFNTN